MLFDAELRELQELEASEVIKLRRQFRWAVHSLSPTRLARKHPYACSAGALLLGTWLASGPRASPEPTGGRSKSGGMYSVIKSMLDGLLPRQQHSTPGSAAQPHVPPAQPDIVSTINFSVTTLMANLNETLALVNIAAEQVTAWMKTRPKDGVYLIDKVGAIAEQERLTDLRAW